MASPDAENKIIGEDLIQEKVSALMQGSNSQYILAALTPELLEKPEYSKVSVGGRSDRIMTLNEDVHPFTFTTFLRSQGGDEQKTIFNTFNNAQLTSLTPMIKFFLRGSDTKEIVSIPLQNMHNFISPDVKALESVNRLYSYLGVKQIDMTLTGQSPETKHANIETAITFYGNNLSVFEKGGLGEHYLPLIVPHYHRKGSKDQSGNEYQLLMQVGWNVPTVGTKKGLKFTGEQVKAIKAQLATYVMRYHSHGFSFNEDGSFQLKVDYISSVDESLKNVNFMEPSFKEIEKFLGDPKKSRTKAVSDPAAAAINNFVLTRLPAAGKTAKKKVVDHLNSKSEKDVFKEIEKLENILSKRDSNRLKKLVRSLLKNRAGFTMSLSPSYVHHLCFDIVGANYMQEYYSQEGFSGGDKYTFTENARQNLITVSREEAGKDFDISQISTEQEKMSSETLMSSESDFIGAFVPGEMVGVYNFFKFGDILTAFLVSSNGEKYFKENNFKIILGNIRFPVQSKTVAGKKKIITASLYDIPIALESLTKVIFEEYVNTTRRRLTFRNFVSVLLTKIIRPYYMEKDYVMDHKPTEGSIQEGQIIVSKKAAAKFKDNMKETDIKALNLRDPRIDLTDSNSDREITAFFYINVCSASPPLSEKALKSVDSYQIGSANSVIKKVSFNQSTSAVMAGIKDTNVKAVHRTEESTIIPQLYNVSLDLIGNINFYPGYVFRLDPTLLGLRNNTKTSVLETLGITGTYNTIGVQHSFGPDGFTTSLDAYNVYVDKKTKKAVES